MDASPEASADASHDTRPRITASGTILRGQNNIAALGWQRNSGRAGPIHDSPDAAPAPGDATVIAVRRLSN